MKKKSGVVNVVLAGCGGISRAWLNSIKDFDDVKIVGLVDIKRENADKVKAQHNFENVVIGDSLEKVIKESKADAVFDCTLPEVHYKIVTAALNAGCHVLGEKPMTDSMKHAKAMVAAAGKNKRIYAVIQNRRYLDDIIRYKDLLKSGAIGKLNTLNADFYLGCHFGGFRDLMNHVLVLDMAIHSFDEARFISGKDPVAVYCHEWNPAGSWYKHGASAVAIFEMTGGVVFTYRGSWCSEGLNTSWECDWRAICTKGSAKWDGFKNITAEKVVGTEGFSRKVEPVEVPTPEPLAMKGHKALIREFIDCVKGGRKKPQTVCTDNIKSLAMVHAAIKSAETRKRVEIKI